MLTFTSGKRYVTRGGERGLLVSTIVRGAFPLLFQPDNLLSPLNLFPKRSDGTSVAEPVHDLVAEESPLLVALEDVAATMDLWPCSCGWTTNLDHHGNMISNTARHVCSNCKAKGRVRDAIKELSK